MTVLLWMARIGDGDGGTAIYHGGWCTFPVSQSDTSLATCDIVREARQQVLDHCNASPKDYKCIFTSGATAALKLVGEAFPWSSESNFMYTMENHNSVLGIRELLVNCCLELDAVASSLGLRWEEAMEKGWMCPIFWGSVVETLEDVASMLGCRVGKLPISYLGLPLGASFKSSWVWDAVEERFKKRLTMWKRQYLSKGGRLTLIKSILSSLLIYFMSLFVIPRKVSSRLEISKGIFIGWWCPTEKPHLVNWNLVCVDKEGGLGICSLVALNKARKWSWRFVEVRESLWKQIIIGKFGEEEGGWRSTGVRGGYGVGVWKTIRNEQEVRCQKHGRRVGIWVVGARAFQDI
ncbi:Molybdenum cofactor sulfurase [Vitis vinifera]|uniref:Molybdenum cofactor sulfurase n=1 Tax=Vitis vinifera TaxID=29760 RepID=A0A438I9U4_VITVI|nr:Molybdenum cofactor sulfurase [Vitis vinifera]